MKRTLALNRVIIAGLILGSSFTSGLCQDNSATDNNWQITQEAAPGNQGKCNLKINPLNWQRDAKNTVKFTHPECRPYEAMRNSNTLVYASVCPPEAGKHLIEGVKFTRVSSIRIDIEHYIKSSVPFSNIWERTSQRLVLKSCEN